MSENMDIGSKSTVQAHWEQNAPINDSLRRIFEPFADNFNEVMHRELESSTPATRHELIQTAGNVYKLPYGRIGSLPPALFGDITESLAVPARELKVPNDDAEISDMVDRYEAWAWGQVNSGKYNSYYFPWGDPLKQKLSEFKGMEYPQERWQVAADAMQRALRDEPLFIMDGHCGNRLNNAALDYDQLNDYSKARHGQHNSYVLTMAKKVSGDPIVPVSAVRDIVQMPIGEYGEEAAAKLARLTVALGDFIKTSPMIDGGVRDRLTPLDEALLAEYTVRTRERSEIAIKDYAVHGTKATLVEGVLTIAQVLAFLTAEKVEGYEDHDALVRDILETDVIEQFTRIVPGGYIGPVTLSGLYMPGVLVAKDGKLALGKEAMSFLSEMRKTQTAIQIARWAKFRADKDGTEQHPGTFGLVCPAAAPKGAITTTKGVLKAFYQSDMQLAA